MMHDIMIFTIHWAIVFVAIYIIITTRPGYKSLLIYAIVCFIAVGSIILTADYYFSLPVLRQSWSTGECVAVFDPENRYDCNHRPNRYIHEWSK